MNKKLSSVVIQLRSDVAQEVFIKNGTFVSATLSWDGGEDARVWFEHDPNFEGNDEVRRKLVILQSGDITHAGFAYLDVVVDGNGEVWHVYQDVSKEDKPETTLKYMSPSYKFIVAMENPHNVVSTIEATQPGARAFLINFAGQNEEVAHAVLRQVRASGSRQTLTVAGGNDGIFYVSIDKVGF